MKRTKHEAGVEAFKRGDFASALKEWRPLAEQGHAIAQLRLGMMYAKGRGVPPDYAEAARWYRRAAEHCIAGAQYKLGVMYGAGQGVPQDYVQAHMWMTLAAVPGDLARDKLAEMMTPAQLAEAERLAREWTPKSK